MATLDFNGTADYVSTTLNPTSWSEMSVSFWLYLPALPDADNERVIDCADSGPINGFAFVFGTAAGSTRDNLIFAGYSGASATWSITSPDLSTGTWYHVAGTYTTNSAKLYFNGPQYGSTDAACSMGTSAAQTVKFARRSQAATNFGNVYLDDIRFYNVVLNSEEIALLSEGKDHRRGLVAHYDGTMEGTTVVDVVGAKNGTGVGALHDTYNIPGPLLRSNRSR